MPTTLDEIMGAARARVAEMKTAARARQTIDGLERQAHRHQPRGFRAALQRAAESGPAIIAELKKASPSKGVIRGTLHIGELAGQLAEAGAAALSVVTEEEFFQGSLLNLDEASAATQLPCLRKDFIVDEIQVIESKANCADALLLIVAALNDVELKTLYRRSREAGLDVLCEVHDEQELHRALDAGSDLIGVNSRDLRTFQVDLATALRLAPLIPPGVLRVAESGIQSTEDIVTLRSAGYDAFLIGEALMRADDPGKALRAMVGGRS